MSATNDEGNPRATKLWLSRSWEFQESMKAALGKAKGELCIVTEGLLGYFSESELISLCQAIHRLLSEYGGCWITADSSILQIYTLTFTTVLKGDAAAFLSRMQGHASNMADVDFQKNSMFLHGIEGARRFLNEHGFNVKSESVDRYIPDIPGVDVDLMGGLREAYKVMEIFTMTVAEKTQMTIDKDLLTGVSKEVQEILETTGFDQFLL